MSQIFSLSLLFIVTLFQTNENLDKNLVSKLEYIQSTTNTPLKEKFKPFSRTFIGENNTTFWFRTTLNNNNNSNVDYRLILKTFSYDSLEVFLKTSKNSLKDIYNYENTKQKELSIPLFIHANNSKEIYFKVHFTKSVYFPISIRTAESHKDLAHKELIKNSMYYGFVVIILLINLFFFKQTKDMFFLYYVLFTIVITLILLELDGFFYYALKGTFILPYLDLIFKFLTGPTEMLFADKVLGLRKYKYHNITVITLILGNALFYLLYAFTNNLDFYNVGELFNTSVFLYYFVACIIYIKESLYIRYLVVAYFVLAIANILFVIPSEFGGPDIGFNLFYFKIASVFELILLLYAISYRYKRVEISKDSLKESYSKSIKELSQLKVEIKDQQNEVLIQREEALQLFKTKYGLIDRELEVLNYLLDGNTNKQIAEQLFLSESSIKQYCAKLFDKTNVKNRVQLVALFNN